MRPTRLIVGACVSGLLLAGAVVAARPTAPTKAWPRVLPAWAPKRPSPEFLKAARTLKPVPEEAQRYLATYVPAWELFGSLSDKQLNEFLTPRQMSDPLDTTPSSLQKSLREQEQARQVGGELVYTRQMVFLEVKTFTPRQRAIWDAFLRAWGEAYRGRRHEDLRVLLYKWGAKKDLSNVLVCFVVMGKHAVHFSVSVRGATTGEWIAQI